MKFRFRGLMLIELMIAMAVTCTIVAGALSLYAHTRKTWEANERIARMQEQGRVALSVIEPDVELAGYYGFSNAPASVRLIRGGDAANVVATSVEMRQFGPLAGDAPPAPVAGLPAGSHACGANFAIDVWSPVQGSNDAFALGRGGSCTPYRNRAQLRTDMLTLRRVETEPSAAEAGRIQVFASRLASHTGQLMFTDGNAPGLVDADHRIHNFVVRSYYIARDSVGQNDFPALRVKTLTRSGAGVVFNDDEVMPAVEDLQVQFGIDAGIDGADGGATRYVDPDFAGLPQHRVVAVRIELRIRSEEREPQHVVMSRTVAVRNARAG